MLNNSGCGCYIGNNFCIAVAYADDLLLLSPTVTGMKRMLSICETYANDHKILFNAKKSQVLFFPGKKGHMAKATFHLNKGTHGQSYFPFE